MQSQSSSLPSGHPPQRSATTTSARPFIRMPNMLARSKRRLLDDEFPPTRPHESPLDIEDPHSFAFAFAYDRSTARRDERPGKRSRAADRPPPPVPASTPQPIRRTKVQEAKRKLATFVVRRRQALQERYGRVPSPVLPPSPCSTHLRHRAADPLTATHHVPCARHGVNCTRNSPAPEKAPGALKKLFSAIINKTGSTANKPHNRRPVSELVTSTKQLNAAAASAQAKRPRSSEVYRAPRTWSNERPATPNSINSLRARWRRFIATKMPGKKAHTEVCISYSPPRVDRPCQCPEAVEFRRQVMAQREQVGRQPLQPIPMELCPMPSPLVLSDPHLGAVHWDDGYQRTFERVYTDSSRENDPVVPDVTPVLSAVPTQLLVHHYTLPDLRDLDVVSTISEDTAPQDMYGHDTHFIGEGAETTTERQQPPSSTQHALVEVGCDDDDCESVWTDIEDDDEDDETSRRRLEAVAQAAERGQAPLTGPHGVLRAIVESASLGRSGSLAGMASGAAPAYQSLATPNLVTPATSVHALAGSSVGSLSDTVSLAESGSEIDLRVEDEDDPYLSTEAEILAILDALASDAGTSVVSDGDRTMDRSHSTQRRTPSPAASYQPSVLSLRSVPGLTRSSSIATSASFASWDEDNPNFTLNLQPEAAADSSPAQVEWVAEAQAGMLAAAAAQPSRMRYQQAAAASLRRVNETFARTYAAQTA